MEKEVLEHLKKLSGKKTLMHPNVNTQILLMEVISLIEFVDYNNKNIR